MLKNENKINLEKQKQERKKKNKGYMVQPDILLHGIKL